MPEIRLGKQKRRQVQESISLKLDKVLGRRAFDRRNNIKVDVKDRLVYFTGSLMIYMWPNQAKSQKHPENWRQLFLRPDDTEKSVHPEISCFQISHDKRTLFVGTAQIQA